MYVVESVEQREDSRSCSRDLMEISDSVGR